MALGVVVLDVLELGRLTKGLGVVPVQMPHPLVQGWIAGTNIADVALEVLDIDGVKADDGGEEADISFGDVRRRK